MVKGPLAFVGFPEHVETLYFVNLVDDATRYQMLATVAERLTQFTAAEAAVA